jgi:hypothetical protein
MNSTRNKIKRPALFVAAGLGAFCCVALAQTKTVTSNNAHMTVNCDGMKVEILGNSNSIALRGACEAVTVNGSRNKITGSSLGSLDVAGNNNAVTSKALKRVSVMGSHNRIVWSKKANQKAPSVSNLGSNNTISATK